MNETPSRSKSLHAIAHNLKELVEEVGKLRRTIKTKKMFSEDQQEKRYRDWVNEP